MVSHGLPPGYTFRPAAPPRPQGEEHDYRGGATFGGLRLTFWNVRVFREAAAESAGGGGYRRSGFPQEPGLRTVIIGLTVASQYGLPAAQCSLMDWSPFADNSTLKLIISGHFRPQGARKPSRGPTRVLPVDPLEAYPPPPSHPDRSPFSSLPPPHSPLPPPPFVMIHRKNRASRAEVQHGYSPSTS